LIFIETQNSFIPTNDYVFKRIFGHVGNEEITKGLLNSILDTKVKEINLEGNTILERDLIDDKLGILDIKAVLNNTVSCDIEMQVAYEEDIEKRLIYYWSRMFDLNIKKGEDYRALKKCIAIIFIDFDLEQIKNIPKSHTEWKIREKDFSKIVLTEVLELHIISLPKLVKLAEKNKLPKEERKLESWVKFMLNPKELEEVDMEENEALKKAKEEFDTLSQDEYEQRIAELREKGRMDRMARERYVRKQGIEEEKEKIAIKMLKDFEDIEKIIKYTELSREEIERLKQEMA